MNAEDFRAFIAFVNNFRDIDQRFGQHFFALRDCGWQETGDAFLRQSGSPGPQPFMIGVVRIKTQTSVAMDIDHARQDPVLAVVLIDRLGSIWVNSCDLRVFDLQLRFDERTGNPDLLTLNNHLLVLP